MKQNRIQEIEICFFEQCIKQKNIPHDKAMEYLDYIYLNYEEMEIFE